jgi:hypothetical protein
MSDAKTSDLKTGTFDTWAAIEQRKAANAVVTVKVDDKAAVRQKIIAEIRRAKVEFVTRSDWKAKEPATSPAEDWNYSKIAIHHAGNSYSCAADGVAALRQAEATDMASFGFVSYHYAIDCQGVIYEALDIRYRGAHIEGGNTGAIGVVFLADFSVRGEAEEHGPGAWNVTKKRGVVAGAKEWLGEQNDKVSVRHDEPTEKQLRAASALTKVLVGTFKIKTLGGHREFAKALGSSRACPGTHGLIIADMLRRESGLAAP